MEHSKKIKSSKYNEGAVIQDYNGVFSILSAKIKDDKTYQRWVFPQDKDRSPGPKAIPMQVKLGSREEAIEILEYFLGKLKGEPVKSEGKDDFVLPGGDNQGMPF